MSLKGFHILLISLSSLLVLLFGGGLSLAATLDSTGFSEYLGSLATVMAPLPAFVIIGLVTAMTILRSKSRSSVRNALSAPSSGVPVIITRTPPLPLRPVSWETPLVRSTAPRLWTMASSSMAR